MPSTSVTRSFEILLAEDNSADVALVRRALQHHQIDCVLHVIRDGSEAINWITSLDADTKSLPLDLVLLDMHLPKRDGEDILRHLRSTERYAQTPVIVMTAWDSGKIEKMALKHAALSYFPKPSNIDEFMQLGEVVQQILARRARVRGSA